MSDQITFNELIDAVEVSYDNNAEFMGAAIEQAMIDVVGNVRRYQKAGEITIKLKFKPLSDVKMGIQGSVTTKIPQPSAAEATVFINRAGQLCADDPKQPSLPGVDSVRSIK